MTDQAISVLFLDNHDSFSYNLVDALRCCGGAVEVWRNDAPLAKLIRRAREHDLLVLSPGPGRPEDAGCLLPLIKEVEGDIPILGICLGHQAVAVANGGELGRAPHAVHGKPARLEHNGRGLFRGMPPNLVVGRYHSLAITALPEDFEQFAYIVEEDQQIPMAIESAQRLTVGLQFHPESILTPAGNDLLRAALNWARATAGG